MGLPARSSRSFSPPLGRALRRRLPTLIFAVTTLAGCSDPAPDHVLLVTIDTLRADRVGCYGYGPARTPNLDRLATEGVRCEDAVSAAPITLPSHASILTGLLPPAHGVRDNGAYALGPAAETLAERLKSAGFVTQAFVSAIVLNRRYGLDQGFDGYDDDLYAEDEPKLFMIRDRPAAKTAARAARWLDEWAQRDRKGRFFLWVHFFDPHQPYEARKVVGWKAPSPYDAEVSAADQGLGTVLAKLEQLGLSGRTLVVVTADHGESLGEHGEKTHAIFIYDATVKVPLIFRLPGLLPAGRTYRGAVRSIDLVPTILSALALPGGETTQGRDLLPALRGRAQAPDLPQYSESLVAEAGFGMAPLYGVRSGGHKWIRAPRTELYDLQRDPSELDNLMPAEARRGARLDRELDALLTDSARHRVEAAASPIDQETMESLQALGYVAPKGTRESLGGMDPKDGMPLYNQLEDARHLAQRGQWRESEGKLRELLARLPTNVTARNVLALTLLHQGRAAEAQAEYVRSLEVDPTQARVYAMMASVALVDGDLDAAERFCNRALELSPGFVEAIANRGLVQALRGDLAGAQAWYEKAQAADPAFPRAWRRSADIFFEKGDWAAALADYERALARRPDDLEALLQAGASARRIGRHELARRYLEKATRLREDAWLPRYNLACLEAVSGNMAPALEQLEAAVQRGFHSPRLLAEDRDLASLRGSPRFAAIERQVLANTREGDGAVEDPE